MTVAAHLLDAIVPIVRTRLPRGVDMDYLGDLLDRNRVALEAVIEQNLGPLLSRMQAANRPFVPDEDIPELWAASKRTAANIAAMFRAEGRFDVLVGWSPPLPGQVVFQGPFALFDAARITDAMRRYRAGGMGSLAASF